MAAEKGGTGGDGQISRLGIDMSASGLSGIESPWLALGWHLVGTWWAISLLLCTNGLRKVFSTCWVSISALFVVCSGKNRDY